jgi:hypothetical protein
MFIRSIRGVTAFNHDQLPEAVNAYKTTMTSAGHRGVNVTVVVNEDAAKCLSARR